MSNIKIKDRLGHYKEYDNINTLKVIDSDTSTLTSFNIPQYNLLSYTAVFKVDDEDYYTCTNTTGQISEPTSPTKEGYTFNGWFIDNVQITFPYTFTSSRINLYAKFTNDETGISNDVNKHYVEKANIIIENDNTHSSITYNNISNLYVKDTTNTYKSFIYDYPKPLTYTANFISDSSNYEIVSNKDGVINKPIVNPTKENYKFTYWSNNDTQISFPYIIAHNSDLKANFQIIHSFSTDDWATIAEQIKSGKDIYNLGDTKTDTITISGTSYTATFKIVDNLVGRYTTQSGYSHKVIEIQELIFNPSSSNGGFPWKASWNSGTGYPYSQSDLSTSTMDSVILNYLSSSLRAVLETTNIYSGPGGSTTTSSNIVKATNKLFCAAFNEYHNVNDSYNYANNYETQGKGQFTWYKNQGVSKTNYTLLKKNTLLGYSGRYWLRSPSHTGSGGTLECFLYEEGTINWSGPGNTLMKVAPCFSW